MIIKIPSTHFLIDCNSLKLFRKRWAKWWETNTSFNIREEDYINESTLIAFPGTSDDVIVINYCMLYAKHYIYLEKLNINNHNRILM